MAGSVGALAPRYSPPLRSLRQCFPPGRPGCHNAGRRQVCKRPLRSGFPDRTSLSTKRGGARVGAASRVPAVGSLAA